jgi:anti-sigma B factor antagonist
MSLHEYGHSRPSRFSRASRLSGVPPAAARTWAERPERFDVEIRPARERVIVVPHGELDMAVTDQVEDAVDGLVGSGFTEIVLDLRRLSFMDSSGLRLVVRQARRPDATVRIIDGAPAVARLFDLTGVRSELPFLAPHEVLLAR